MSEKHAQVSIVFEENANRSAAYDGEKHIGECEFTVSSGTWTITHTGVRPEYGGRGIARRLVERVIDEARARRVKIVPVCSYAVRVMESGEYGDVL